ncbi:ATP-binding protein [Ammonicoccus fulvus]|uniref:ATP-binding protein n=1 Tax=Ammonicoccus fulvus TaxID=3138240 RepID=A0ABZ3FX61_9ACTN
MTHGDRSFVGRGAELEALRQAWSTAVQQRPGLVLVSGEAGIGKSSLVGQLVDGLGTEAGVLLGQCLAFGAEAVPYAAISQILKSLVARHGADRVREWAGAGHAALGSLVPALGGDGRVAESQRAQVFEAVGTSCSGPRESSRSLSSSKIFIGPMSRRATCCAFSMPRCSTPLWARSNPVSWCS